MPRVTLARHAMATRFEIVLQGDNPVALRAAGEEALDEIDRLEAQLSLFRPGSEIARLNGLASRESVRVTPALFSLLEHAARLNEESQGAFDITVAPLVRCWGFMAGDGRMPTPEDLSEARAKVGMNLVRLNRSDFTVRFAREGVMLDLGAIGKGYAIERAAELLREAGVTSALLHGGTSTVYALGPSPDGERWQVSIESPEDRPDKPLTAMPAGLNDPESGAQRRPFAVVALRDEALSVSAIWGKFFQVGGKTLGHILDPRTGQPATRGVLAAIALPSATETDALSTALLTLGPEGHGQISQLRPSIRTLVVAEEDASLRVESQGITASWGR